MNFRQGGVHPQSFVQSGVGLLEVTDRELAVTEIQTLHANHCVYFALSETGCVLPNELSFCFRAGYGEKIIPILSKVKIEGSGRYVNRMPVNGVGSIRIERVAR